MDDSFDAAQDVSLVTERMSLSRDEILHVDGVGADGLLEAPLLPDALVLLQILHAGLLFLFQLSIFFNVLNYLFYIIP